MKTETFLIVNLRDRTDKLILEQKGTYMEMKVYV